MLYAVGKAILGLYKITRITRIATYSWDIFFKSP